jgi:predicted house-cleaning noncanonical NTP pyrophosphatase (MazG superfamily)
MEKLVRDFIPAIIHESGRTANYRVASSRDELIKFLTMKLGEESLELVQAEDHDQSLEEAGDLYEVVTTLLRVHGITIEEAKDQANKKFLKRGGFLSGYILHT